MEDTRRRERDRARTGRRMRRENAIARFRIQVINNGQLTQTLSSFIRHIRRTLAEPTLQTRERYERFNNMHRIINRAIRGRINVEISQQDRSRIALIGLLLRQLRTQMEPNLDTVYLGHDSSSSDEEATEENEM